MTSLIFILILCLNSISFSNSQIIPIIDYFQSWFEQHEIPPHKIIQSISPDIEERIYEPQKWICTREFSTPNKIDEKRSEMFFRLFAYSEGRNNMSKPVQVTLPISTEVDHRNGDLNSYRMCFYLPKAMQENPPTPTGIGLNIINRPELRTYVKRFGGYASESTFTKQMQSLSATLSSRGLKFVEEELGLRAIHYNNIYDAPAKFWNRRNEVWLLAPVVTD